ncbi:MAG: 4Fe-4S dicluster domain-containing protein [Muribaculaceae bacterium]|nr:4Fe-4S dicluster domain-containing protein [Muribaculaceae bacterium]
MPRKIRITLAIIFWTLITAMFLDFTGTLHHWLGWMAKIQFLPAVLAVNTAVVVGLVAFTLLMGRVYCSVICPLGVFQDIVSYLSSRRKGKKKRFRYSKPRNLVRYGVLAVFIILLLAGFTAIASLIAPYSAYGRMVQNLGQPVALWLNNLLVPLAEHYDSYSVYTREIWIRSLPVFAVAAVTLVAIVILAWRGGRVYCNTICPVGTILGLLSRHSLLRPVIDTSKCINCGSCARRCKSSCIDARNHTIDLSRCVACMDCIDDCSKGAISFTTRKAAAAKTADSPKPADSGRRSFLIAGAMAAGSAAAIKAQKTVDGGLAEILDKKLPARATRLVPAGSVSLKNFSQHCTACQLCVSECPNGVLRPSTDLNTFMQPRMEFDHGYCRPECHACSDVCPAGAIRPISWEDKSSIQIGHAVWVAKNCVVLADDVDCGNCARHCLVGAITMVPSDPSNPDSRKIPAVDETRCIGCGGCENLCPARPFSAIYVEGHEIHRTV